MPQDEFGNWVSGITPAPTGTLPSGISGALTGDGPPDNGVGSNGQTYIDLSTGDFYTKAGDVWNLVAGGGSGGGLVGVVDPEGVVTAATGTSYVNTVLKKLWYKESGSGNTGWVQYI